MSVFDDAVDILYGDINLGIDATWRADGAGAGTPVRVILSRPDEVGEWGRSRLVAATCTIDVRVKDVPTLAAGDTFTLADASVWVVQQPPKRDVLRLIWRAEAHPQ